MSATVHFVNKGVKYHLGDGRFDRSTDSDFLDTYPVVGEEWIQAFTVTADDADNLVACALAREVYGVRRIISRITGKTRRVYTRATIQRVHDKTRIISQRRKTCETHGLSGLF